MFSTTDYQNHSSYHVNQCDSRRDSQMPQVRVERLLSFSVVQQHLSCTPEYHSGHRWGKYVEHTHGKTTKHMDYKRNNGQSMADLDSIRNPVALWVAEKNLSLFHGPWSMEGGELPDKAAAWMRWIGMILTPWFTWQEARSAFQDLSWIYDIRHGYIHYTYKRYVCMYNINIYIYNICICMICVCMCLCLCICFYMYLYIYIYIFI